MSTCPMSVSRISRSLLQAQPKDACIKSLLQKQHPSASLTDECCALGSASLTSFPELMLQSGFWNKGIICLCILLFWHKMIICCVGKLHVTWCPMPSKIKIVSIK